MFLKIMTSLCVLLALALFIPRPRSVPSPIANVDLLLTKSGVAYRYPAEYYPLGIIDKDYEGPVDSVRLSPSEILPTLKVLLDGLNYDTPDYEFYKTGEFPKMVPIADCHYPRFILVFRDEQGRASNYFSVCFECGNATFITGTRYPINDSWAMSKEGREAFQKLQDHFFPVSKDTDEIDSGS